MDERLLSQLREKSGAMFNVTVLINAILIAGLVAFAAIYIFDVRVKQSERDELSTRTMTAETMRVKLEGIPMPVAASDDQIKLLLAQTPTDEGWESFFADMDVVIGRTGIAVERFDFNMEASRLNELMNRNKLEGTSTIVTHPFTMTVHGSYEQLVQFIQEVYGMQRIVDIGEWQMAVLPRSAKSEAAGHQLLQLNFSAAIFQAMGYEEVFQRVIPQKIISEEQRSDPTWSDESFFEQLQPKK